jgi:hypothetical protein
LAIARKGDDDNRLPYETGAESPVRFKAMSAFGPT